MEGRTQVERAARDRWYRKDEGLPTADEQTGQATSTERWLCCARCGHRITPTSARTQAAGAHVHTRINPHGYVWRFGCFARAPGCRLDGEPTTEHTWFAGHAWQLALCGGCSLHLGWRFGAAGGSFFGLVLEHLVEVGASGGEGPGGADP